MSNVIRGFAIIIIVAVLFLMSTVLYTVSETQHAIVIRFGEAVGEESEPGLKVKLPIDSVVYIDKRNLEFDLNNPLQIIASNEERLNVDAFIRYKIVDPLAYYEAFRQGTAPFETIRRNNGNARLEQLLTTNMRNILGGVEITEIITTKRFELMQQIQAATASQVSRFGVEIIDLRIRRADFPDENAARVYERMKSEYVQEADRLRAEGDEEARKIQAAADLEVSRILSEAEEESLRVRGRADAERNAIFNDAYGKDPEFFAFYRSLLSYEAALQDGETTIILSPDSEFFRFFSDLEGAR